ncbi:hypothetical protein ACL90Y_11655 [Micrococcus luteus]
MTTDDPAQILDGQQRALEEQAPAIAKAVGASRVKTLRQTTCTGQYDPETMGESVQWGVNITRDIADLDAAKDAASPAQHYLEEHGWTLDVGPGRYPGPITTIFTGTHDETGLQLIAEHRTGGNESLLVIRGGGSCMDMPKGNQMVRSHLDNGFGIPQAEYDWEAERRSPDYQEYSLPPGEQPGPVTDEPGPLTTDAVQTPEPPSSTSS